MDNLLPSNEFVEVEDRYYVNPQTQVDEATSFIDQLRATQGQQNQEVTQQTQRLGTDVPTNLGGLTGAGGYFTSRLQTPQTAYNIANLRATAQAAALNDVLSNEYSIWKNRYTQAYRNSTKSNSNNGGNNGDSSDAGKGDTEEKATDADTTVTYEGSVTAQPGQQNVIGPDGTAYMYVDGEYIELRPGQTYKPTLDLTPTNSLNTTSPLAPTNTLQRR